MAKVESRKVMTEEEWLNCENPQPMLEFLQGRASSRRLRLFSCAIFRRIVGLSLEGRIKRALEIAEQCAEGHISVEESFQVGASLNLSDDCHGSEPLNAIIKATGEPWEAWHRILFAAHLLCGWISGKYRREHSMAVAFQRLGAPSDDDEDDDGEAVRAEILPIRTVSVP